jgi:SAM-dependent methyltransferase
MTPQEKQETIKRYTDRLMAKGGPTVEVLGWRDQSQQELRFDILAGIDDLNGKSVLDVGCGFGDFYDYLLAKGHHCHYVGIDINPTLLEVARTRHPALRFEERDILAQPLEESFDYVVESGVFNHRLSDNEAFAQQMFTAMYAACRLGVAANLMSDRVSYTDAHLYYFSPESYLRYCSRLSPYVTIRHDYPLYEFTVYLYRTPPRGVRREEVRSS